MTFFIYAELLIKIIKLSGSFRRNEDRKEIHHIIFFLHIKVYLHYDSTQPKHDLNKESKTRLVNMDRGKFISSPSYTKNKRPLKNICVCVFVCVNA